MRYTTAAQLAGVMTAALLAACSTTKSSTAPNAAPTQADAQSVAEGIEGSLQLSVSSLIGGVNVGALLPSASRARATRTMPYQRLAFIPANMIRGLRPNAGRVPIGVRGGGPPSCVVQTPASPTDQDGDGIPDTLTLTAGAGCTFTPDTTNITIAGSIVLGDPTPTTADADYVSTVNHLVFGITSGSDSATIGINGTATVTETTGSLSEANQLTLTLASNGTTVINASYAQNWMSVFTFTGSQLTADNGLPAGSLSVTGTTNYTTAAHSFALAVSTLSPLAFDPTCNTMSQITGGSVKAVFSGTTGASFVTMTWSGCQDPTVTFSGQ
jgi:hypothetical protein